MKSSTLLLLKTFLKSTSSINVLRHSQDKAKRKYAKNSLVGEILGSVILAFYGTLVSLGLAKAGLTGEIPTLCAELLFAMPFILTLLKSSGYLFGFKEYDMIMSMPFSVNSIVTGKFLYMYIKSISLYGLISLSMLIGYSFGGKLNVISCISWIILTFVIPVCPMVIASALGALTAKIGARFKYKNIAQAILTMIIILPLFFSRFFIEDTMKNEDLDEMMNAIASAVNKSGRYVPFAKWFADVIKNHSISSFLMILGITLFIEGILLALVSKYYRQINSSLTAGMENKKFVVANTKQRSMAHAIALKEFKRMTGSSAYLVNVGLGVVMVPVIGLVMLFLKPEAIIDTMMNGAPISPAMIFPAIPMLFYFFLGMVPTTSISPSLEGKNYWIIKTLPIDPMDDCKGKSLFNLYLFVPAGVFSTVIASARFGVSFIDGLMSVIAIVLLIIFSTIFGLRSGLKHRRLDWENEIEVIKQGMAVSMCIIPHLIICIIGMPLVVVANFAIKNVAVIMAFVSLLTLIAIYFSLKSLKKYM